jgi:hypothetical protein
MLLEFSLFFLNIFRYRFFHIFRIFDFFEEILSLSVGSLNFLLQLNFKLLFFSENFIQIFTEIRFLGIFFYFFYRKACFFNWVSFYQYSLRINIRNYYLLLRWIFFLHVILYSSLLFWLFIKYFVYFIVCGGLILYSIYSFFTSC